MFTAAQSAIEAVFAADTWLGDTANVKGLFFTGHDGGDDDALYPYVAYFLSEEGKPDAEGRAGNMRLQFNVYSEKRRALGQAEVNAIMDHLLTAYSAALTVTGYANSNAPQLATRTAFRDPGQKWQGVIIFDLQIV